MRSLYFNQAGQPIDVNAWATAFGDFEARVLGADELCVGPDTVEISTVWFGLDQCAHYYDVPMIFESMVFGGPLDGQRQVYATRDDALAGHADLVAGHLQLAQESS